MEPEPTAARPRYLAEPNPAAIVRPRYLKTPDAATHLGLSPRTLEKHRCFGTGPVYRRLGGRIVYAIDDLDAWAARGTRKSTSDPGVGTVLPAQRRFRQD
ncbi:MULTISPECIES: helix-turn-helix transcriptional regulator [Sphingomonadales]|jgi:hypothetical protein|uniref:helix-turn-helix transcriptional regulator n=1 Tax=Sphingomonadales TaxID=204457 RepID=UPI000B3CAD64|nr:MULTISPECIES: helix-turn-helix domain-containing protein [Sphingomonadales]MBA4757588.1 helix-turn-helix domain-containing protein [Sphingosinicella sp.]